MQAQAAQQQASHSQDHQALHSQVCHTSPAPEQYLRDFIAGIVDRHRFDTDPGPIDADPDPDPDPDWHQNKADPHTDPTPSFTHVGIGIFLFLVRTLDSILKFLEKDLLYQPFDLLEIDTEMDRHGLDADPDPDPTMMQIRSDPDPHN